MPEMTMRCVKELWGFMARNIKVTCEHLQHGWMLRLLPYTKYDSFYLTVFICLLTERGMCKIWRLGSKDTFALLKPN